jgi:hypothetical protein
MGIAYPMAPLFLRKSWKDEQDLKKTINQISSWDQATQD